MQRLDNKVMKYAWGHATALASLQGRAPTGEPEAELWLGAHPGGPSLIEDGRTLGELLLEEPARHLGRDVSTRYHGRLPYLLKVLAAAKPLSLQAHPSLAQAAVGFAREEAAGVPRNAPERSYKDANHKPELICALTRFEALCGFRETGQTAALLEGLGVPMLTPGLQALQASGAEGLFRWAMTQPVETKRAIAQALGVALQTQPTPGFEAECRWGQRLANDYPGDIGVLGALMLNLVTLKPGEALYLPAGNLHAYLEGVGVELMASSDNVLRGGLTPKHVDVAELLAVLDFRAGPVKVLRPVEGVEEVYLTPAPEFRLSRVRVGERPVELTPWSAEVLLCTEGSVRVEAAGSIVELDKGQAAFASAFEGPLRLTGGGVVYRATTNDAQ